MRVAITGARGFVGSALTRRLIGEGWDVVPYDLVPDAGGRRTGGVPVIQWDIASGPLAHAPTVDAVVHVAAHVSDVGPASASRRVNVGGTESVAATFSRAQFVHISSCSVYDPHHPQRNATEDQAPALDAVRYGNPYGRTKREAELLLAVQRPDAIVLRPHAVYGPGDTTLMPRLREVAKRGRIPLPHGGNLMHSLTHIDNLVEACRLATLPEAPAGTYNINDGAPVLIRDALSSIGGGPGGKPQITAVPVPVLLGAAVLLQTAAAIQRGLTRRPVRPRVTRYSIEHLAMERTFDTSAAQKRLGYTPEPTDLNGAASW